MDLLLKFDLVFGGNQKQPVRKKAKPNVKRGTLRKPEMNDLKRICAAKGLDMNSLLKFDPWIHTKNPWMLLPAFVPTETKKACGWMRVHLDGELIELKGGRKEKYPMQAGGQYSSGRVVF